MRQRRRMVLGALVLLGLGLALLAPYAWSRYDLRAAEQALKRHDLRAARAYLEQSLRKWPTNARTLLLMAQTARRLDDGADAERRLTE